MLRVVALRGALCARGREARHANGARARGFQGREKKGRRLRTALSCVVFGGGNMAWEQKSYVHNLQSYAYHVGSRGFVLT